MTDSDARRYAVDPIAYAQGGAGPVLLDACGVTHSRPLTTARVTAYRDRRGRKPNEALHARVLAEYPTCADPRELARSLGITYGALRDTASRLQVLRERIAPRAARRP